MLLSEVGPNLEKEYQCFKEKFTFPLNPAFFHRSQAKNIQKRVPTLETHLKT